MTTSCAGLPSGLATVRVFSILLTTSMPSMTLPKTTCLPLRWGVPLLDVMMKNWQPLVLGLAVVSTYHVVGNFGSYPLF
jgi:hypothetical protein